MSTQSLTRHADLIIATLAARQHGVVARWQLLARGVTSDQIKLRLINGRLHEIHRGVYLVGHQVSPPHAHVMGALLACRDRGVLSHESAAALWELRPHPAAAPVCVTVPRIVKLARPGIRIRRADLDRRDIRRRHGMPLTSPPRTILDLASRLPAGELEHLVAEAAYRKLASERELVAQLSRNPGKPGNPALRRILGLPGGPMRTRSRWERAMLRLLREAGITGFETNVRVGGYEVDLLWRGLDFAVEIDGYDGHGGRVPFERDRLKIARLKARGIDVMPVTPRQIRDDPKGVLARLSQALELVGRRADAGPARSGGRPAARQPRDPF